MERNSNQMGASPSFPYFRIFKIAKAERFFSSSGKFFIFHTFKAKGQLFLFLIFYTSIAFSQPLQIDCNGNVGIGTSPVSTYKLKVANTSYFNTIISSQNNSNYLTIYDQCSFPNGSYPGLIISNDPTPYGKVLYPSVNNSCKIGLSTQAFSEIWSYSGDISLSDKRQKENVKPIEDALLKVMQLNGIEYDLKKEFVFSDSINLDAKTIERLENRRKGKIGFIAQDVYKIIPGVVVYDDATDIYGLQYDKIVPLLAEAIKEQQKQIETLQNIVFAQENEILSIKNASFKSTTIDLNDPNESKLYQNTPNPFNQTTEIRYFIADGVNSALLTICNLNGIQLRSIPIKKQGEGNITLEGNGLKPGIYLYTLIADGQLVDTKEMVITE